VDSGIVGETYRDAIKTMDQFLRTGKGVPGGYNLLYKGQSVFHSHRKEVIAFVDSVFTQEYLNLPNNQYYDLRKYQHAFTTGLTTNYPYSLQLNYNWPDVLLGDDIKQGWGKSIITKTNLKYTHDNAEVYNIATINR
jgi:hypothetical protein